MKKPDVKSEITGITFEDRDSKGDKILVRFWVEDDENWHKTNLVMSNYWLDDLIKTCKKAKKYLKGKSDDT